MSDDGESPSAVEIVRLFGVFFLLFMLVLSKLVQQLKGLDTRPTVCAKWMNLQLEHYVYFIEEHDVNMSQISGGVALNKDGSRASAEHARNQWKNERNIAQDEVSIYR